MRWPARDPFAWKVCFAWLPVKIDQEWIWLERYERQFCCEYYAVRRIDASLGDPT